MKCPACGADGTGNFCARCGASLTPATCSGCGAAVLPGARFCTQCGTPTGAAGANRAPAPASGSNLPWYIGGAVLLALAIILLLPMLRSAGDNAAPPAATQSPAAPGPLTGTPREQADRLFNRIMQAREAGDTVNAVFFTPMAVQAYQNAEPLDDDGLYHLASIQLVAGDLDGARRTADRILATNANHLLALAVAGEAASRAGDTAAARGFHQRFLDSYDAEMAKGLQEYLDHSAVFPEYRQTARRATER